MSESKHTASRSRLAIVEACDASRIHADTSGSRLDVERERAR